MVKTTKPGRDGMIRVTFSLPLGEPGGMVSVVGDFIVWDPFALTLRKRANQTRSASVSVPQGSTIRFRYLGEGGVWFDDETIDGRADGDSVITV